MVLSTLLVIAIVIAAIIAIVTAGLFGGAFLVIFGDVIVFGLILWAIIKLCFKKKKSK